MDMNSIIKVFKSVFFIASILCTPFLLSIEHKVLVNFFESEDLQTPLETTITLEHATTDEELTWGLMQRTYLHKDQGMTFNFPEKEYRYFWMFNCFIDLSLAYVDDDGFIIEIHQLRSFPEVMDPERPIEEVEDLALYKPHDPILKFFSRHGITSSEPVRYALETNKGWFKRHKVKVGDAFIWSSNKPWGYIRHAINVSAIRVHRRNPSVIVFQEQKKYLFKQHWNSPEKEILFLDSEGTILRNSKLSRESNPISSHPSTKYALFTTTKWLLKKGITVGDKISFLNNK